MMKLWSGIVIAIVLMVGCASQPSATSSANSGISKPGVERMNAGWGYIRSGNYQRAKHHLDRALEHDPNGAKIHAALGYYYAEVGEYKRAEESYQRAIKLDKNDGDNLNLYGVFLCRQGKFAAAENMFDRVLDIRTYGNMAATLENAGLCALKTKNIEKAEKYFIRAIRHNPTQAQSLLELAYLEFSNQSFVKSRAFLDRHVASGTESSRSLWLGIQLAQAQGNKDMLASWGLKLERMFPESEEAFLYQKLKK